MGGRAVVTGGAGFIGSNLVDRLIDDGHEVLVVDDLSSGKLNRLADARRMGGLHFHQIDVRAPELAEVFARFKPDLVFHLAAQIDVRRSVDDPVFDTDVNVVGSVNTLAAAVEAGAARFVFVSSGGATYGDAGVFPTPETARRVPESPYGVAKKVVDEYLRYFRDAHGLDYMSMGPANVYGPRQDPAGEAGVVAIFTRALLAGRRPVIFGDGSQRRDYVYVEDVTDALVRAAEVGGGRFLNVGTGRETTVLEIFERLRSLTNRRVEPQFVAARPGDVPRSCLDPTAAGEHLGWEAWTPLDEGLARTVEWFRTHDE